MSPLSLLSFCLGANTDPGGVVVVFKRGCADRDCVRERESVCEREREEIILKCVASIPGYPSPAVEGKNKS